MEGIINKNTVIIDIINETLVIVNINDIQLTTLVSVSCINFEWFLFGVINKMTHIIIGMGIPVFFKMVYYRSVVGYMETPCVSVDFL